MLKSHFDKILSGKAYDEDETLSQLIMENTKLKHRLNILNQVNTRNLNFKDVATILIYGILYIFYLTNCKGY